MVTMVTGAFVGAVQIDTAAVETDSGERTFIHIWREDTGKGGRKGEIKTTAVALFYKPSVVPRGFCRSSVENCSQIRDGL